MHVRGGWAVDEQGREWVLWAVQVLPSCGQVWTEGMVPPGARTGHEGPAVKCFKAEHVMPFQCNDFVFP